jgi:hypothetical protein
LGRANNKTEVPLEDGESHLAFSASRALRSNQFHFMQRERERERDANK